MAHNRNDSIASTASSFFCLSSEDSANLYDRKIKPAIEAVSQCWTQDLVEKAEKIINETFAPDPHSRFVYKKTKELSIHLDKVMLAMLECAEECGGEDGKRYVACAIWSCSKEENVIEALAALGTTWLTHLLFIFKINRGYRSQLNTPSELATPTIEETTTHFQEGLWNMKDSFWENVTARDGYTCVLTGIQDISHPNPIQGAYKAPLIGAHILRRVIGEFDDAPNSKSSTMRTFDILRNFACLPVQTPEELCNQLDDPSNVMTLHRDACVTFHKFYWCLNRTEEDHVYGLKVFKDGGIIRMPENNRVSFVDHSRDFLLNPSIKKNPPVNLPNPLYIAIHAAVTEILNISGAGNFFDELLDEYRDDEGNTPSVQSWSELETLMGEALVRESIAEGFRSVKINEFSS